MENKRVSIRRKMLETLPKNGVGAEIGVWEGKFSSDILAITDPTTLHLIDPWQYMPEFSNTGFGRKRNADRMAEMYQHVVDKFKDDKRVVIHRSTSAATLSKMEKASLDWVYIDGNHNAPFIADDLSIAMQKVKPGGVIAGDDYYWNKDEGAPVKTAVQALVTTHGDTVDFELIGQQYIIRRKPD
jgi:hypothetical protein